MRVAVFFMYKASSSLRLIGSFSTSTIEISMSLFLFIYFLQCFNTDDVLFLRCSITLLCIYLMVLPIYYSLHFLHRILYTASRFLQMSLFIG